MNIAIIIVCIGLSCIAFIIEKRVYNPITVFTTIWATIVAFASMQLFGLYEASSDSYKIILISIIFFSIGAFVAYTKKKTIRIKNVYTTKIKKQEYFSYKRMYILGCIIMVYMLVQAFGVYTLLQEGFSMFDIRSSLQGYSMNAEYVTSRLRILRTGTWPNRIYDWIILPGLYSMVLITCMDLIIGKRDKKLLFITVLNVILKVYSEGTRILLFNIGVYLVFLVLILGKKLTMSKKTKRYIRFGIILLIIGLIFVSNIRLQTMKKSIWEEIYLYFSCTIPLWDKWYNILKQNQVYTYGAASLYGLIQIPVLFSEYFIPVTWYRNAMVLINQTEIFFKIRTASYSTSYNAFTTMFYYFYLDGGILGCIIGSLVFGFVCGYTYVRLKRKMETGDYLRSMYIYLVLVLFMVMSFIRFSFARVDYAMMLFFAYIFIKKRRNID